MEFSGRTAVVTGAARGIGAAIAKHFAFAGAHVFLNDVNDAQPIVEEILARNGRAEFVQGDVTRLEEMHSLVGRAVEVTGRFDHFVANAAYSLRGRFYEQPIEDAQKTINVTMWGAYNSVRAASDRMVKQKARGSIVVIGSPHAVIPVPRCMAYNMAKAAVDQMAKTAAAELLPLGIRVNLVHPGWTNTPGERRYFTEEEITRRTELLPTRRLATPDEIARAVLFLASDDSEYINGATLSVDGGLKLPRENLV